MNYQIRIENAARKEILDFDDKTYDRVSEKINLLQSEPRPSGCKKLRGSSNYRIRVGDFRVIYSVNDKDKIVDILSVTNRKDSYR